MSDSSKFSLNKLKEFSNSLVEKTDVLVNKVKTTVNDNDLVNKVKNSVGMQTGTSEQPTGDEDIQTQAQAIQQSLKALYEAQKQQLVIMNSLKQQVQQLLKEKTGTEVEKEDGPLPPSDTA